MNVCHSLLASAIGGEISGLIETSGLVAKTVLVILLLFSVASWAIIFSKWGLFRRARVQSNRFMRDVPQVGAPERCRRRGRAVQAQPAGRGLRRRLRRAAQAGVVSHSHVGLQRATQIASSEELTRLESRLPWLATTGAVTPFIGLFGTVWGIIDAFHGLGTAGAATLRAVAPGVSEALITTAAGLFAAIPAVIAYNMFTQHIREFGARMDDFSLELINEVERAQAGAARASASVERR